MAVAIAQQVEVNGLLMGPGTPYAVVQFNPYVSSARHTTQENAWAPGSWSGDEQPEATAVPLRLEIEASDDASWLVAYQDLRAALRASRVDVPLRWMIGTTSYEMAVRPRLVDPDTTRIQRGEGVVSCALMALDPRIYSATVHSVPLGLPSTSGGLTAPFTVPFTIGATTTSGRASLTNAGDEPTRLLIRIDANGNSLVQPRVTLVHDGVTTVLRANLTLTSGQYLVIDTQRRTAYLNGTSSRRGYMQGDFPLLPSGTSDVAFDADTYSAVAQMTVEWRDTW